MFCTVQPDATEFSELEHFTPDSEVSSAVILCLISVRTDLSSYFIRRSKMNNITVQ